MFYNQFNNSCCDHQEKENKVKGNCSVKVIQECCYPSYFDLNKDDDKCEKEEAKCCNSKNYWEEETTCHCNKKDAPSCRNEKQTCGLCRCFRRW